MSDAAHGPEDAIRSALEAGDFQTAATLAMEAYGTEIHSFVSARLRSRSEADEAFSMFAEDLWKGLPGFAFRSSVRGWLYVLARNAAHRHAASPHRLAERNIPLSVANAVAASVDRSRSHLGDRTGVADKIRALRERLSQEDRTLLLLFVDRKLPWREVALVMHEGQTPPADADLTREAARLRKRFERVKADLKAIAIAEGLIER
jgi:RNA polymerase sigma-70 factor, ECF subfamily